MNRRELFIAAAGTVIGARGHAQPDDFPRRPITVVYPYPPGTAGDAEIREMSEYVRKVLGQPLVLDYRPGASGTIATQYAMRQPADGYSILFGTTTTMLSGPAVILKTPYSARADFEPIGGLGQVGTVLSVPAAAKYKTLQELLALLKAQPGKLNYGTIGPGSSGHLYSELFLRTVGATATPIAYKGPPQAQMALLNSEIDFLFEAVQTAKPQMEAGHLRILGVADTHRVPQLPDVPTLAEGGVPLRLALWTGFFAPKGTPKSHVERLSRTIFEFLSLPDTRTRFGARGLDVTPSTPQEFEKTIAADEALWLPLIRSLNLQPQ